MRYKSLFLLISLIFLLTGCSSEESLPDMMSGRIYSGSKLKVTYCGELMPAKEVEFIPAADGNKEDRIILKGITDLSQLSSIGLSGTAEGPGVIPGSPVEEIPVRLVKNKDRYEFSGSGSTNYISSFTYKGKFEGDSCVLAIDNVELSNMSMTGKVWTPVPLKRNGVEYTSMPFRLVWELDPAVGIDVDLSGILKLLATIPVIPTYHDTAYSSVAQLYDSAMQTVVFLGNGNIIVRYFSSVGGATQLMTSVGNTLQYVLPADNMMLLYPNPTSLFGLWLVAQSDPGDNPDISFTSSKAGESEIAQLLLPVLKELIPDILGMCTQGIPVEIERTDTELSVYLNTQTILTLLGDVVNAIENNPEILEKISEWLTGTPELADVAADLKNLLPQLQQILLNTTKVEIGLNFELQK